MAIQRHTLVIYAAALVMAASVCNADNDKKSNADVRQEAQISTTYALSPYLRDCDLKVSVEDGKATLTGTVEESVSQDLAKQIALGVSGIKEVDDKIVVMADYKPAKASPDRSFGEVIDDASVTTAIKSKLLWSKNADGMTTGVDTKRGKVVLTGSADSAAARELTGRMAMNTHGVRSVDNQLIVKPANRDIKDKAKAEGERAQQDMADAWITAKVKSTFIYSTNIDATDISVSTDKGVVDLSGKVGSGAEQELAIELAQNLRGVKSVTSNNLRF